MAEDSGKKGHNRADFSQSFNWDEFNGILDGLATSPATPHASPTATDPQASPNQAAGDGIAAAHEEDPRAPLPRVHPQELVYHKAKARRRRVLVRRSGPARQMAGHDPAIPAEPGNDLSDSHREWSEQRLAESLAARLAPVAPDGHSRSQPAAGHPAAAPARPGRTAPASLSAFDRALENEMRGLSEPRRANAQSQPVAQPLAQPVAQPVSRPYPGTLSEHSAQPGHSGRYVEPQYADAAYPEPPYPEPKSENGRVVVFGAIAIVALLLSGVSAVALFSGSDVGLTSLLGPAGPLNPPASMTVARTPVKHNQSAPLTLKPILSPAKSTTTAASTAVEPIVPRQVATTRINTATISRPSAEKVSARVTTVRSPQTTAAIPAVRPQLVDGRPTNSNPDAGRQTVALAYAAPNRKNAATMTDAADIAAPIFDDASGLPPEADPAPAEADFRILSPVGEEQMDAAALKQRKQMDALLERGHQIMESGDIASARLFYNRVYEAGDPRGALALAQSYDPETLRAHNVIGLIASKDMNRLWNKRAEELANRSGAQFVLGRK